MSSNLATIGFDVDSSELENVLRAVSERAVLLGERDGRRVLRWQDDDGARVVLVAAGRQVEAFTPSFAAEPGADLEGLTHLNDQCWSAAVMQDGQQATAFAADVEQSALLDPASAPDGRAAVTALGAHVQVLPDEETFAASPASLLDPERDGEDSEPPAHYADHGWAWPPRMAPESFVSYGVWGDPAQAQPGARLNGTVLRSRTCRNSLTGTPFHVARVRTAGFEADVCLAVDEHPQAPPPGAVVAGSVYLVVSLEQVPQAAPRRGLRLPWKR